jgi:hypothetical protein
MQSDPDVQQSILRYLKGWREDESPEPTHSFIIDGLIDRQTPIRWHQFFEGGVSCQWMDTQQAYYKTINSF